MECGYVSCHDCPERPGLGYSWDPDFLALVLRSMDYVGARYSYHRHWSDD